MEANWAETELRSTVLKDRRRVRTLIRTAAAICQQPQLSLSAALGHGLRQAAGDLFMHADTRVADLIAGHVDLIIDPLVSSAQHIKSGKLRALAVTPAARLDVFPDVPTVAEFVPGYEASGFAGIGVPRGTPVEIVDRLNKELNAGLADSKIKARIVELGGTVMGGTPAEFGTIIAEATEKWAKVIKFAGIKVE